MVLTEEQRAIAHSVREFVEAEVVPIASKLDNEAAPLPDALISQMAKLGYFGLIFPPDFGGAGLDTVSMVIVAEELTRGWLCVGSVMTRMVITGTLIATHGTEEQKRRWLPKICSGELLTAAAFTEPHAGSDAAAIACRAERAGDVYRLTGEKAWCTFADRARLLTTSVRTSPGSSRHEGISIIMVAKEPGFTSPKLSASPIPTIGYQGVTSFNLAFDGYEVPAGDLLGGVEGKGFRQLMATFEHARIQTAARAVGVARAAFEAALAYAKEREQFGQRIGDFQVIAHKLARAATEIEAARQLTMHAAQLKDTGKRCDLEAGMAKAFAAEMVERVTSEMLQVFGGYGYSRELPAQRYWRDGRLFRIFEGTSEIQYEVIAKHLLG